MRFISRDDQRKLPAHKPEKESLIYEMIIFRQEKNIWLAYCLILDQKELESRIRSRSVSFATTPLSRVTLHSIV